MSTTKELQKYYACDTHEKTESCSSCKPIYLASEADAIFAFISKKCDELEALHKAHCETIDAMKQQHAEEIERLKAGQRQIEMIRDWNDAHFKEIEKQAERYEKLRKLTPDEFKYLRDADARGAMALDAMVDNLPGWPVGLVDQLPASGEQKP